MKIIDRPAYLLFATLTAFAAHAADFDATVDFSSRFELSLPVSGQVQTVKVTAGQAVAQGDEMLVLDPAPFKAARAHAQSRVNLRQTILSESQRDLKQQQELYDRTVLATVELENAQLREKRDRAALEEAQAELADAEYELAYSRLIAPFSALVLSVETNPGQSISNALQSRTLLTLVRQGLYQAVFYVPAAALENLTIGQKATVNLQARAYPGTISGISYEPQPVTDERAGLYKIQAEFTSQDKTILIGRKAKVHID